MIALLLAALACDEVDDWIRELGAERFEEREAATLELMKRRAARPRVAETLDATSDLEVAVRLRRVLLHLDRLAEARGLFLALDASGSRQEPLNESQGAKIGRRGGGYVCLIPGPLTYDREDPRAAWLPVLQAEIRKPCDIDPPVGLELLARFGGFPELIPALRERARSDDPLVKRLCEQAIRKQGGTP